MRILALIFLITFSIPVNASESNCENTGKVAESIMTARQAGMDMSEVMNTAKETFKESQFELVKLIIINAYRQPRFRVEENQQDAIKDYKNDWLLKCYESEM